VIDFGASELESLQYSACLVCTFPPNSLFFLVDSVHDGVWFSGCLIDETPNNPSGERGARAPMNAAKPLRRLLPLLPPTTHSAVAAAASAKEALGEILEFVSNPDNLWALTRELLAAVVSHVRAPR